MSPAGDRNLTARPLSPRPFAPYGAVIDTAGGRAPPMNAGMASRFHDLATIEVTGDGARVVVGLVQARSPTRCRCN